MPIASASNNQGGQSKGAPISKAHQNQITANKARHAAYFASGMREQNKAKRLAKHLKARPWDGKAYEALRAISITILARAHVKLPERVEISPVILRQRAGTTLTSACKTA